jgi:SAM-dependent methyltransferase
LSDTTAAAAFTAAQQAYARGDAITAIWFYLDALVRAPDHPVYRQAALNSLVQLDSYQKLPRAALIALEACATDPALDVQALAGVVKNLYLDHPSFAPIDEALRAGWNAFDAAVSHGAFDAFFNNTLLLAALTRTAINAEPAERALTRLRRASLHSPALLARHRPFIEAMACHCVRTRHMWGEAPSEQAELAAAGVTTADKALLHCLYHSPLNLPAPQQALLPPVLQKIVADRHEERRLADTLAQFTNISPGLSTAMQAQYESFPYPLWEQYGGSQPATWDDFLARFVRAPLYAVPRPAQPEILVAGCGTGRFCIDFARYLPDARITATDLSKTSLGYAMRRAREANVSNIQFGVGDILRLGELNRSFHFIECGGVLHHMADPLAGLRALVDLLVPGGLMCIALYSERARVPIVDARAFVAAHNFPDTIEGMRAMRQAVFALPATDPVRRISRRMDFYWADGLHDLVFNVHEIRYTPLGLKSLIADAGLSFLGFELNNPAKWAAYTAQFPHDPLGRDLGAWNVFEETHSDTFRGMFQFWLQKPA